MAAKLEARGADLRYTLTITLEEAATGTEKRISFVRQRGGREDSAKLSITVPAGVKAGQRLKLRNEGDGPAGPGKPGDLYVIIGFQDHPLFKLKNVTLAPHMGGIDQTALDAMAELAAQCIVSLHATGQAPAGCVVNAAQLGAWKW